jgi:general secretion pathway protein D
MVASLLLAVLALGTGCSSYQTKRRAQQAEQREDWDTAVLRYLELTAQEPDNARHKAALLRAKIRASQVHFERGKRFHEAQVLDRALIEYQQAAQLDPTNQYAAVELEKVRSRLASARRDAPLPLTLDEMKDKTRSATAQPPILNPRSKDPISLDFPKPVSLFDIYKALGKAFGINVLFDPNLRDQNLAIELKEVTAVDALEILMRASGQFYKVVDEHSIIIAADNPQNRRNYEDQVIQTFFLSNSEVKEVVNLLRSLIGAKNVATNEQLNAITIRDTADKVKVAQRIIEGIDKSKAEVVIDVELLQVNTSRLLELGVSLSQYQVTQSVDLGEDAAVRWSDLQNLTAESWILTIPSIIYDFVKTNSDGQLLAKPQVRISEGEKASLHIGDKVPIPVTSFNTSQTVGGGTIIPITSFQYQDVGIRIEIEPRVHHNKEVTLKLKIEVSQITSYVVGSGGQRQPVIGTRNIESKIRLKDGETNFLAGLIRTDESHSDSGLPGLSDLPVIGRLFGKTSTDATRTDVLLTLTPHIIRTPNISEEDLVPVWVGTEQNITFRGGSPRVESEVESGPFEEESGASPEEIQEKIRERLQRLPRGLQQSEPPASQPAPGGGVELVPGAAPSDAFRPPVKTEPPPEAQPQVGMPETEPPGTVAFAPAPAAPVAT